MNKLTTATTTIIIINVIMFFMSTRNGINLQDALALYHPENNKFAIWQFISSMFMHGSIMHLAFNMLALWMFGSALEQAWGKNRFLFFYFATGIGAGVIYTLINMYQFSALQAELLNSGFSIDDIKILLISGEYSPTLTSLSAEKLSEFYSLYHIPVIGASGAIYGVLVAYAMLFPNSKLIFLFIPYPIAAKYFVPALLALDLFSGVTGFSIFGGGIAHFAHIGGAIVGFLLMMLWRKQHTRNPY